MSYTAVGKNKVYTSIEDLPENQKMVNGDRILVQTEDGTALVDFANVKIDLAHVTFGTQVTKLIEFTSSVEQYIETMDVEFSEIKEETQSIKVDVQKLKEQMECCKLLFKYVMGSVREYTSSLIEQTTEGALTAEGLAMYQDIVEELKEKILDFDFNRYNLAT